VYVGSDLLVYFTAGNPRDFVVPDDFVDKDCDPGLRRVFKIWEEQRVPNVIFEVTSKMTRRKDQGFKPQTYARIGVKELFLYDPTADYLKPPLAGYRLEGDTPQPIAPRSDGSLECRELGLLVRLEEGRLLLLDFQSGQPLLTEAEAEHAAREAAEARVRAAEAEIERLHQQLAHLPPQQ
jgi:Uma2 family endonuclease